MITQDQRDLIHNALAVGMAVEDAFLYAGLSARQMQELEEDEFFQLESRKTNKEVEYGLLDRMHSISIKQQGEGRETATTWLLEKLYSRYSSKNAQELGSITLQMTGKDIATLPTVEISGGKEPGK